ncbi:MAG: two-component system cell cycle sensor histidine kinase/response regulator CckA [Candidatus Promineifilaceae bacterium]
MVPAQMKKSQENSPGSSGLGVSMVMAAVLLLLNLMINFSGSMHRFFAFHFDSLMTRILVNFLFFWIVALLVVTYMRWRKLNSSQRELEAIISGIGLDALIVIDQNRTISVCNDAVRRIFGWSREEILGKQTDLLYSDRRKFPSQPREIYEALKRDGYHYGLATGIQRDGTNMPLEIITGPLEGRGGAVLLIRDISERVAMEAQQARLEERTRQAKRLEGLGVLAGGIAHDFRNILTVVRGHAELAMRRQTDDPMLSNSMKEILKGSDRAHDLCQNLLAFAGRAPRDLHAVSLSDIAKDTTELMKVKFPEDIQIVYELEETLPKIQVDDVQMQQVILNLVSNAADAMDSGGGTLTVRTGSEYCDPDAFENIMVNSDQPTGDYISVTVIDEGCGMDEETRKMVCEPFFTTKPQGHGMGMAAVMGIVRSHQGIMRVVSAPGEGSEFCVLLPMQPTPKHCIE